MQLSTSCVSYEPSDPYIYVSLLELIMSYVTLGLGVARCILNSMETYSSYYVAINKNKLRLYIYIYLFCIGHLNIYY